ncbi:MAG TPA: MFS transporter [Clostridia bacterium]|nr:MFS transporter [Clostridia bacterium]
MSLIMQVKSLPKEVKYFVATEALLGIGMGILGFVLNLHFLVLGISPEQIGALNSVGTLIMGLTSLPAGFLANRLGRKRIFITGIILIGMGYNLFGWGTIIWVFYLAQVLTSVGVSLLITTEIQLLFSYAKTNELETLSYSLLFASFTLFSGVGTLLGGYFPSWLPFGTTKYQWAIYISAFFIGVTAVLRGILLPCLNNGKNRNIKKIESMPIHKRILKEIDKKILLLTFYLFLMGMAFSIIIPFQNVIIKFRMGWSDEYVSYLLTINGLVLFFASMIMPWVINRFGNIKAYYYVYGINLLLTMVLSFNVPVWIFSPLFLLRSGSFTLLNNMIDSQTMSAVEENKRDLFAGMRTLLRSTGSAIASYLAGYILENKNYLYPFLTVFIVLLISFLYFIIFVRPIFASNAVNTKFYIEEEIQRDVEGI